MCVCVWLSVCLSMCPGSISSETAEWIWLNVFFAKGRKSVPGHALILVVIAPGVPPWEPKMYHAEKLCDSCTDQLVNTLFCLV